MAMSRKHYQALAEAIKKTDDERMTGLTCLIGLLEEAGCKEGVCGYVTEGLDEEELVVLPLAAMEDMMRRVADVCAEDNPRFDRERFMDAAGYGRKNGN